MSKYFVSYVFQTKEYGLCYGNGIIEAPCDIIRGADDLKKVQQCIEEEKKYKNVNLLYFKRQDKKECGYK